MSAVVGARWRASVAAAIVGILAGAATARAEVRVLWHRTLGENVVGARIALAASGDRLAVISAARAQPISGEDPVLVLSGTGEVLWRYSAPAKESLGGIAVTLDGRKTFCDYWGQPRVIKPYQGPDGDEQRRPGGRLMAPLDVVAYAGGIYCFGPAGKIEWKTRAKGVEVGGAGSSPLGRVTQVAGDRLLVLRPGWECERGLAVLDFSGRVLLRRQFAQEESVQNAALFPDGRLLAVGGPDRVAIMDLTGKTLAAVDGWGLAASRTSPVSPDGRHLLVNDWEMDRIGLLDRAGRLKWTYAVPSDWSRSIVAGRGDFAGESVIVAYPPLIGAGPQGTSVLLVRGTRRLLFRFPGSSYVLQQVELPAVEDVGEDTFLSPDGTTVVIVRNLVPSDGSASRGPQVRFLADSGKPLGELDLPAWRWPGRWPLSLSFSNPMRYCALSVGPDLYFIEVTPSG